MRALGRDAGVHCAISKKRLLLQRTGSRQEMGESRGSLQRDQIRQNGRKKLSQQDGTADG